MSRDAQHPRRADVPRGVFDIPADDLAHSSRPGQDSGSDRSSGLFDPDTEIRAIGETPGHHPPFDEPTAQHAAVEGTGRRDTGRVLGAPILGSGPEIARSPRREPTGRHQALRQAPFAPAAVTPAVKPSGFERLLDAAQRWRSPLGLGLAALITIGVVVVYERSTGDEEIATAGSGAEGTSAFASVTEFDQTTEVTTADNGDEPQSDVNSAVDEMVEETASTAGEESPGQQTTPSAAPEEDPASPTTTNPDGASPTTPPTTTPAPASTSETIRQAPAPTAAPNNRQPSSTASSAAAATPSTEAAAPPAETTPSTVGSTTTPPVSLGPTRTEAEAGTALGGATIASVQTGHSGAGYVTGLVAPGDGISLTVTSNGGMTPFAIGYSAGPADGAPALRTIGILVDGDRKTSAQMNATPTFDDWTIVAGSLELPAGQSTITIEVQASDSGQVNIDYIEVG